jgi:hypothetical protein
MPQGGIACGRRRPFGGRASFERSGVVFFVNGSPITAWVNR